MHVICVSFAWGVQDTYANAAGFDCLHCLAATSTASGHRMFALVVTLHKL